MRELNQNGLGQNQRTWVNDHTVYTHGYGVVAAYGNKVSTDGRPAFFEQGIPSAGDLGNYEPRVYFGENSPEYSIVGAPEGTEAVGAGLPGRLRPQRPGQQHLHRRRRPLRGQLLQQAALRAEVR